MGLISHKPKEEGGIKGSAEPTHRPVPTPHADWSAMRQSLVDFSIALFVLLTDSYSFLTYDAISSLLSCLLAFFLFFSSFIFSTVLFHNGC